MKMTDELWIAFGFKKDYGWNTWGWIHTKERDIRFFEGVSFGMLGSKEPQTVEELLSHLHKYWKVKYTKLGIEENQYNLRNCLGISL